jgi:hypothetical protein
VHLTVLLRPQSYREQVTLWSGSFPPSAAFGAILAVTPAAALPYDEANNSGDECEAPEEDVRPLAQNLSLKLLLLLFVGFRRGLSLRGGDELHVGIARRIDTTEPRGDEGSMRSCFVGQREHLNVGIALVFRGFSNEIAVARLI